jgi:hypothetical protein
MDAQPAAVRTGWAVIPIALWKYRNGEFEESEAYCRQGMNPQEATARTATVRLILAMASCRNGQLAEAREQLTEGRQLVEREFQSGLDRGVPGVGMWYDWVFARILLREATSLIETPPAPAPAQGGHR